MKSSLCEWPATASNDVSDVADADADALVERLTHREDPVKLFSVLCSVLLF